MLLSSTLALPLCVFAFSAAGALSHLPRNETTATFPFPIVAPPQLDKRVVSTPNRQCPFGALFGGSSCNTWIHPRRFTVSCTRRTHPVEFKAYDCAPNQVCMDGPPTVDETPAFHNDINPVLRYIPTCYCVVANDYARLAKIDEGHTMPGEIAMSYEPTSYGRATTIVNAILTDETGQNIVNATYLVIRAQKVQDVVGKVSWLDLPGGVESCAHCASVGIEAVPEGTERIDVSVGGLEGNVQGALLYLASLWS